MSTARALLSAPLAVWERDGLKAALAKAGLPADNLDNPHSLFWRFETAADIPAGFGGLEIYAPDALVRSVVTLPPVRGLGIGRAIVSVLETEARARQCSSAFIVTTSQADFFARLGYRTCSRSQVPEPIRRAPHFNAPCCADAVVMVKKGL
jgi:N-acetylglutamate synthase-like GNAT family acetyltransferase